MKLIDKSGKIYWSTNSVNHDQPLFPSIFGGIFLLAKLTIVVVDADTTTITQLDGETGQVVAVYDTGINEIIDAFTEHRGVLYVWFRKSFEIHALTPNTGSQIKLFNVIDQPGPMKYIDTEGKMMISCGLFGRRRNYVDFFEVPRM